MKEQVALKLLKISQRYSAFYKDSSQGWWKTVLADASLKGLGDVIHSLIRDLWLNTGDINWLCRMCWMCFTAFPGMGRIQTERREGRSVKLMSSSLCQRKAVFALDLDCVHVHVHTCACCMCV